MKVQKSGSTRVLSSKRSAQCWCVADFNNHDAWSARAPGTDTTESNPDFKVAKNFRHLRIATITGRWRLSRVIQASTRCQAARLTSVTSVPSQVYDDHPAQCSELCLMQHLMQTFDDLIFACQRGHGKEHPQPCFMRAHQTYVTKPNRSWCGPVCQGLVLCQSPSQVESQSVFTATHWLLVTVPHSPISWAVHHVPLAINEEVVECFGPAWRQRANHKDMHRNSQCKRLKGVERPENATLSR